MSLLQDIFSRLSSQFTNCEEVASVIALAIESGENVLLWGPAGHGKSEMTLQALSCVADDSDIFVQSFGEGMDEATLWGGLDFPALQRGEGLRYFPESSFLSSNFAVFEEIFDAPTSVLLALKDTLTAKRLRKGAQSYAMKTRAIIALTNKDPGEISDMGPAAHALIERFPLQLRVAWPSYTAADYARMLKHAVRGENIPDHTYAVLSELFARTAVGGSPISPRSAVKATRAVLAAQRLRGGTAAPTPEDMLALRFISGMEGTADALQSEIEAAAKRAAAEDRLNLAKAEFAQIQTAFGESYRAGSPIGLLKAAKLFVAFSDSLSSLAVPDSLTDERKRLRESAAAMATKAQTAAMAATRV
jgi:MoxR-like ATPase